MTYDPRSLESLNTAFKEAVNGLLPFDRDCMDEWLRQTFQVGALRNVLFWFDRGGRTKRRFLSPNTSRQQKPYRILFAQAFLGYLQNNRPSVCKDFELRNETSPYNVDKFREYLFDDYVGQNLTSISIDGEIMTLCYASESSEFYDSDDEVDMDNPIFDEFRSGREEA